MQQIDMRFSENNHFRKNLVNGRFTTMLEYRPPSTQHDFNLALKPMQPLFHAAANDDGISSFLVLDRINGDASHPVSDVSARVRDEHGREPVAVLSGRGLTVEKARGQLGQLQAAGVSNILAVSGDWGNDEDHSDTFLDSLEILRIVKGAGPQFFAGSTVNPFKYTVGEVVPQYAKLMKKVKAGADFIITQAGWDMAKFQELQWFLSMREVSVPVIARVILPSYDEINEIDQAIMPGLHISKVFAAILQRECSINYQQALAVHFRRIPLIVAGLRLLGYSGVQLVGIRDERHLQVLNKNIDRAVADLNDWDSWLQEWKQFHHEIRFSPEHYDFYLFNDLLTSGRKDFSEETEQNSYEMAPVHWRIKTRYMISRLLGLDKRRGPLFSSLKMAMYKSLSSDRRVGYLPLDKCPKGLVEGPCGGGQTGGRCEVDKGKCLFYRNFELVEWQNKIHTLED